jgi:aspartate racemase
MKLIGVVGGVGPEASNKFCEMLVKYKKKKRDQDNIPFLHYCNPQIPDRTEAILGIGEDPTEEIINTCTSLQGAGADFLVIPCNTAHHFLTEIQESVDIPIVDMTKVLVRHVLKDNFRLKKVGILATTGSVKAGIFQDYFNGVGIETILPEEADQEKLVMGAIYGSKGIKAGRKIMPKKLLTNAAKKLIEAGAESIVLGCTEIPLVLKNKDFEVKLYDSMEIVSKEIIKCMERESGDIITVKYVIANPNKEIMPSDNEEVFMSS